MEIVVILIIYLLSTVKMYFYFKNSFSSDGQWSNSNADAVAVLFTFCPIFNSIFSLMCLLDNGKREPSFNLNKFFGVKK